VSDCRWILFNDQADDDPLQIFELFPLFPSHPGNPFLCVSELGRIDGVGLLLWQVVDLRELVQQSFTECGVGAEGGWQG
jgi:hypothetical protein